jgi:hypothetical protein
MEARENRYMAWEWLAYLLSWGWDSLVLMYHTNGVLISGFVLSERDTKY